MIMVSLRLASWLRLVGNRQHDLEVRLLRFAAGDVADATVEPGAR